VQKDRVDIIKYLAGKGANLNCKTGVMGITPEELANKLGLQDSARLLKKILSEGA
jgi:hypothetical protein